MEISRNGITELVHAARLSRKVSDNMRKLLKNGWGETDADDIYDYLTDCISELVGDHLEPDEDFEHDSVTMRLLNSPLSDEAVADYIIRRAEPPKPITMTRDETKMLFEQTGGYRYETPEGEWK